MRQFIVFAVAIGEHGASGTRALLKFFELPLSHLVRQHFATPSKQWMRSTSMGPSSPGIRPGIIGPPETKMHGRFNLAAAMSMPGMILSQLSGMNTSASKPCAFSFISTESAISSFVGQAEFHTEVIHGDAITDTDGVELERHASAGADSLLTEFAIAGGACGPE